MCMSLDLLPSLSPINYFLEEDSDQYLSNYLSDDLGEEIEMNNKMYEKEDGYLTFFRNLATHAINRL